MYCRYDGETSYSAIAVLRLLLLLKQSKEEDVKDIKKVNMKTSGVVAVIENMMDHNEDRRTEHPDIWRFETEFIVKFIHDNLGLSSQFPETDIRRAAGVLATNATNLQLKHDFAKGLGLYPVYSMMNHSCM